MYPRWRINLNPKILAYLLLMDKTVYLLIGPKGSGKSFIGQLFETAFNIPFVRVEDWAKAIKRERAVDNEEYVREIFEAIKNGIAGEMERKTSLVFESTGLTEHFKNMVAGLEKQFKVVLIKVDADLDTCLHRVKTRDQSIHVNVSDEQVVAINNAVKQTSHLFDFEILNINKSIEELVLEIRNIVEKTSTNH